MDSVHEEEETKGKPHMDRLYHAVLDGVDAVTARVSFGATDGTTFTEHHVHRSPRSGRCLVDSTSPCRHLVTFART